MQSCDITTTGTLYKFTIVATDLNTVNKRSKTTKAKTLRKRWPVTNTILQSKSTRTTRLLLRCLTCIEKTNISRGTTKVAVNRYLSGNNETLRRLRHILNELTLLIKSGLSPDRTSIVYPSKFNVQSLHSISGNQELLWNLYNSVYFKVHHSWLNFLLLKSEKEKESECSKSRKIPWKRKAIQLEIHYSGIKATGSSLEPDLSMMGSPYPCADSVSLSHDVPHGAKYGSSVPRHLTARLECVEESRVPRTPCLAPTL
ncbi:hypothetical protein F511_17152 [Dorcoceras hygrometricum]|uniref:Uncharacterized protein n=1 Tax=Dorcoceras hygrometricum TaxID=472368 RepID=A0A2Z7CBI0_9LAMI|nr:hypothetical protein F511_17152 [Dorcoceras hygrometricum]